MSSEYVSTGVAARAIGVGTSTLNRWVTAGVVTPAYRTPGGQYRWDLNDLRRQLQVNPPSELTSEPPS